jgi:hypothetical protein
LSFDYERLEESIRGSSMHKTNEDLDYEYWSSDHNAHATLSKSNSIHDKCINQLYLPEKYHITILDSGADNFVLG